MHMNSPHLSASEPELGQAHGIGEEDANNGHHSPAAVVELTLLVPGELLGRALAEAERVEATVAGCMRSRVFREAGEEKQ